MARVLTESEESIGRPDFPGPLKGLRELTVGEVSQRLLSDYADRDRARLSLSVSEDEPGLSRTGDGSVAWADVHRMLVEIAEVIVPGTFAIATPAVGEPPQISALIERMVDRWFEIVSSFFSVARGEEASLEEAAHSTLHLISKIPDIRAHAGWNIFASLKDPAVWDSYVLRDPDKKWEVAGLNLIPEIDEAIRKRQYSHYFEYLSEHGLKYAIEYQIDLVRRSYPGWRALMLHEISRNLALGGKTDNREIEAEPVPFLSRLIAEHIGRTYQTDLHPECEIGDANFFEHPHRGITTGQTGRIGIGCVIYPCTLGGVTGKVKQRHPLVGDFVLIGTDVGIYGPVKVGDGSVVGPNTEISGFVELGKNVKIRPAVVARTVIRSGTKPPGKIIIEDGSNVGEEVLLINDHERDLVIAAGSDIPAHSHVINDGEGGPLIL